MDRYEVQDDHASNKHEKQVRLHFNTYELRERALEELNGCVYAVKTKFYIFTDTSDVEMFADSVVRKEY